MVREVLPRNMQNVSLNENQLLQTDLGIGSIGLMSLAFQIEEDFNVDIMCYAEEFTKVHSIGDLQNYVNKFKNQK